MTDVVDKTRLRIMTFNIRGSHHRDGLNAWRRRADLSARVIQSYAPDLIGFQEIQRGNAQTYNRRLAKYRHSLGPKYENFPPHAHNAIYWNPERLRLLDSGGFWLSETPEKFSGAWGTAQKRSANRAVLRLISSDAKFIHLNTHLDHKSVASRHRGASLIVRRFEGLAGERLPVIVTGDFNADPGSPVHRIFTESGFGDAHLLANNLLARTFHKFQGEEFVSPRPEREGRIDWVLVRDAAHMFSLAETHCQIVRDAAPPVYPSDHYPVVADISFEETANSARLTWI